ncbi:MAG: hypothetical protein A2146_00845 [Actinobacteria bacterium RBG_16_67_10]|nr:MAG: hypothetical protein A2146_00845 [Actinobacteria bacterium RBG_16_67_10]
MDYLRPELGEDETPGPEPEDIDALVLDRLAAYGHKAELEDEAEDEAEHGDEAEREQSEDSDDAFEEAVALEDPETDEAPDFAAEQEPAVEVVLEAEPEPGEPEVGTIAPGPSEPERRRRRALRDRSGTPSPRKGKKSSKDKKPKKLVGLKIGASQIAAAQIVNNGAPELVEVFREPLEPGLVVSGEIRDPDALGEALKRFFELHKLPKRGIRLGLANNRIGVRVFEIDGVTDPQQLDNAIRFRAEEVLPIPLDQAVLDYVVLEEEAREDGTSVKRILLVVAYREVVDRYLQACRGAGLHVVGIDLEAFALLRALEAPADRDSTAGALVAVAIGHDRTTIAVSNGRLCEFTRVLDWGGWSLNVAIARELDKAPSEVEGIKRQVSLARDTEVEGLTSEQVTKVRSAVQRALDGFTRELVASLHFYQAQPGALGIGEVVLTGGAAHMVGLPEAVGELVGVPIRLGDPFKRVKVGPNIAHDIQHGSVAVAIGLGIED